MFKQTKILWILLIIAVLSVVYLIIISKPIENKIAEVNNKPVNETTHVDLVKLEKDYVNTFKGIFENYNKLLGSGSYTVDQLVIIRDQILSLRVPGKFKELHIDFVFAISKMERFLVKGEADEKIASEELIDKIKANITWLN